MSVRNLDSIITVNPSESTYTPKLEPHDDTESPRKKAMKCTLPTPINIEYLQKVKQQKLNPKKDVLPMEKVDEVMKQFVVKAMVGKFTEDIFERDAPFYQNDVKSDFKLWVTVTDETGHFGATMFRAARAFTAADVETMMGLWEKCGDEEGRTIFLDRLNTHAEEELSLVCSAKVWEPQGDKEQRFEVIIQDVILS